MQQQRGGPLFGLLPDIQPEVEEEIHVGREILFAFAFAGRAHDESARNSGVVDLQNPLQAQALFVAGDFARNAGVFQRRHVDHVSSRQRDMGSNARALLAQRLLGDLNDDLLAFLEQLGDGRQRSSLGTAEMFWARDAAPGRVAGGPAAVPSPRSSALGSPPPAGLASPLPSSWPPPRILRRMRRGRRCI